MPFHKTISIALIFVTLMYTVSSVADTVSPFCNDGSCWCPQGTTPMTIDTGAVTTLTCFVNGSSPPTPITPLPQTPLPGPGGGGPVEPVTDLPGESQNSGHSDRMEGDGKCTEAGNPVSLLSRNKFQQEIDYVGGGSLPLTIVRSYSSFGAQYPSFKGPFGQGWASDFGEEIMSATFADPGASPAIDEVVIRNSTGYRFRLTSTDGGPWTTSTGRIVNFSYDDNLELFLWIDKGVEKIFHKSGDLYTVTNEVGEQLTHHYVANSSPSRIEKVEHSFGGELNFTYDAQDRISKIIDSAANEYEYFYDQYGNLDYVNRPGVSGVETVNYEYKSGTEFAHDNLLSEIWYPQDRGLYAKFDYLSGVGAFGKSTEHVGASSTSVEKVEIDQIAHSPNLQIQTTNPHGKLTTYTYEYIGGERRLTEVDGIAHGSCAASNSSYTYDSNGFYDKITDEENNVVDLDYDQFGLLISATTGFGTLEARTTNNTWHEGWEKLESVSTALLDTVFELDGRGRPEKITQTNKSTYGVLNQQRVWNIAYTPYANSAVIQTTVVDGPKSGSNDLTTTSRDTNGRMKWTPKIGQCYKVESGRIKRISEDGQTT